jgi:hypothetical protein
VAAFQTFKASGEADAAAASLHPISQPAVTATTNEDGGIAEVQASAQQYLSVQQSTLPVGSCPLRMLAFPLLSAREERYWRWHPYADRFLFRLHPESGVRLLCVPRGWHDFIGEEWRLRRENDWQRPMTVDKPREDNDDSEANQTDADPMRITAEQQSQYLATQIQINEQWQHGFDLTVSPSSLFCLCRFSAHRKRHI